jgi:NAD-dependent deacetylase
MTAVAAIAQRMRAATRVTVLTGAGVSAASGVPTFRGPDGLWRRFRPEELATPEAFARDPLLVWEWYAWRRERVAACEPNLAHVVIADWSHRLGAQLVTQNVDDLHARAGTRSPLRLHGSIWELACWSGCGQAAWRDERVPLPALPPRCVRCGGLARPAVVWFGEPLDARDLEAAVAAADCDLFLTVGTSAVVYPAAGLVQQARRHGAFTAEINMERTAASSTVDVAVQGPAEEVLPAVNAALASLQ